jgi:hypothetical protein
MNLKNTLRTLFNIRTKRKPLVPDSKPQVGSKIVRGNIKLNLKYPISDEQWEWLTLQGWRTTNMRTDRRRYLSVPDKMVITLLNASEQERDGLHALLLEWALAQTKA